MLYISRQHRPMDPPWYFPRIPIFQIIIRQSPSGSLTVFHRVEFPLFCLFPFHFFPVSLIPFTLWSSRSLPLNLPSYLKHFTF